MKIIVNDKPVTFPSSLSELTLGQRIDFYNLYGRELNKREKMIAEMEGIDKEFAANELEEETMIQTLSFFINCTPEALKESKFLDTAAAIYYSNLSLLVSDDIALQPEREFAWKGEQWILQAPDLKYDIISYNELETAKKLMNDLRMFSTGNYNYLLPLCSYYLIKKDEPQIYNDPEKMEFMRDLPMNIALQVIMFLSEIVSLTSTFYSTNKIETVAND